MEAENIRASVAGVKLALKRAGVSQYELLIIDCKRSDGSDDGTPAIADELSREDDSIKVFHNEYINLGSKYWMGVDSARYPYVVMIPGDNEITCGAITEILRHVGDADVITSYPANMDIRPWLRRYISYAYTFIMNSLSGLNLRYFNGVCVHRKDLLLNIKDRNDSFAYMAEILIQLLKLGHSYVQVPIVLQPRRGGKSAAFKKDNIISVGATFVKLFLKYRMGLDCLKRK